MVVSLTLITTARRSPLERFGQLLDAAAADRGCDIPRLTQVWNIFATGRATRAVQLAYNNMNVLQRTPGTMGYRRDINEAKN